MDSGLFTPVGRICKTHGLKGEVSVVSSTGTSLDVLVGLAAWIVPPTRSLRQTRIIGVRPGPKGPIVQLEGVDSIDDAAHLRDREMLVRTSDLPAEWVEPEDADDDTGLVVVDEQHGELGEVVEVIVTGANDVWVVEGRFGEVLIPVIDDVVLSIDEDERLARVRLLEGLLPGGSED